MRIFSFHLVETAPATTLGALFHPPRKSKTDGLLHAECLAAMTLGSPILSPERFQLRKLALFAFWENEDSLDRFLTNTQLGRKLAEGWHVRMTFLRQWGEFAALNDLPEEVANADPEQPVVAVTLARLKLPQVSRFVRWGKPVEEQVRDDSGTTLAMAAMRPPRTFSTFSIWRSQQEMTDMVHGRNSSPDSKRHAKAMAEQKRKDFHEEFTTFRFRAISEHGEWLGKSDLIPRETEQPTD